MNSTTTLSALNEQIGIMNPAFAVGRGEILSWLNSLLKLKLQKIEETCSGAVACQVMDVLFPNVVQMHKVNWGVRSDWEYVANYKILQIACDKVNVDRKIDVDRLIKGRYQDNFEFLQWLKKFYENNVGINGNPSQYDAVGRRLLGKNVGMLKWNNHNGGNNVDHGTTTTTSNNNTVKPIVILKTPPSTSPIHRKSITSTSSTTTTTTKPNTTITMSQHKENVLLDGTSHDSIVKESPNRITNQQTKMNNNNHTSSSSPAMSRIAYLEQALIRAEGKLSEIEALIRGSGITGALAQSILEIISTNTPQQSSNNGMNNDTPTNPNQKIIVDEDGFHDTSADW
jgi:hypothetical protein